MINEMASLMLDLKCKLVPHSVDVDDLVSHIMISYPWFRGQVSPRNPSLSRTFWWETRPGPFFLIINAVSPSVLQKFTSAGAKLALSSYVRLRYSI